MSDQFELPPRPEPEPDPAHESAAPPPPPLSERFADVFMAPGRAMAAVAERPAWGIPALVIFALMAAFSMATMHIMVPEQTENMAAYYPAELQDQMLAGLDAARDPSPVRRVGQGIQSGLAILLFALMLPALVLHLFSRLSEGKGTLKQTFGVVFWAGLIVFGLKTLLTWIVVALTGTGRYAALSLQVLLPDQNPLNAGYALLGFWGDPFFYWTLWLVIIGLATVHRFSLGKAAIVVGAVHVLFSGLLFGVLLGVQLLFRSVAG